jgi:hypothetical protein
MCSRKAQRRKSYPRPLSQLGEGVEPIPRRRPIAAAPIVAALSPLVNAAVSGLVIGLGGIAFAALARLTGIAFTPDFQAKVEKAVQTEAGIIALGAEDGFSKLSIPVSSPIVAQAAVQVANSVPGALKAAGITPQMLTRMVAGELGKIQAQMSTSAPAPRAK